MLTALVTASSAESSRAGVGERVGAEQLAEHGPQVLLLALAPGRSRRRAGRSRWPRYQRAWSPLRWFTPAGKVYGPFVVVSATTTSTPPRSSVTWMMPVEVDRHVVVDAHLGELLDGLDQQATGHRRRSWR